MSARIAKRADRAGVSRTKPGPGDPAPHAQPGAKSGRSAGSWWPAALVLLFCVALGWRLAYLHRLAASPLGGSLTEDARFYWNWSAWLLRHDWVGAKPFFLAPLYPYVLAVLRMFRVDSVQAVLTLRAIWGAVAVVALADAARRITRPGVGLAVGVLAAFYETAVFFDGLVLTESLLFFLESLLLWWIVARAGRASAAWVAAVAGLLVGLIAEGRATSGLLLLPAVFWVAGAARGTPHAATGERKGAAEVAPPRIGVARAWPGLAALAGGFLVVTAPVATRNWVVGHEWIPFTYNFGFNLYAGYNPEANGAFNSITGTHAPSAQTEELTEAGAQADGREYLRKVEGVDVSPAASSAYWANKAWRWMRANPRQGAGLGGAQAGDDVESRRVRADRERTRVPPRRGTDRIAVDRHVHGRGAARPGRVPSHPTPHGKGSRGDACFSREGGGRGRRGSIRGRIPVGDDAHDRAVLRH